MLQISSNGCQHAITITIIEKGKPMNVHPQVHALTLLLGSLLFLANFGGIRFPVALAQEAPGEHTQTKIVTGILKELNLQEKRGTIVTDLGEPVFFALPDPEMLADISQGQHVTAGINPEGVLTKIIETPVPELQEPLK